MSTVWKYTKHITPELKEGEQFEALCDGIIDFKSEEGNDGRKNLVRIRSIRGRTHDSTWRHLRLDDTGEVTLDNQTGKKKFGIRKWLKGPTLYQ